MNATTPTPTPTAAEAIITTSTYTLTSYTGVDIRGPGGYPFSDDGEDFAAFLVPICTAPAVCALLLLVCPYLFVRYARETARREQAYAAWLVASHEAAGDKGDKAPPPYGAASASLGVGSATALVLAAASPATARVTTIPVLVPTGDGHTYSFVATTVPDMTRTAAATVTLTASAGYRYTEQRDSYERYDAQLFAVMGTVWPLVVLGLIFGGWAWYLRVQRRSIDRRLRAAGLQVKG
ncbi:hypothetical protein Q8F55_006823 [Vanrija albida]|uniref:Integral membrane protein n=1 Tax=Vanrija albida TaxID=181172 RepID=A0ABR3PY63_9TREE